MKREKYSSKEKLGVCITYLSIKSNGYKRIEKICNSKAGFKSGTSIGANIEKAIGAQSRRDFKAKLSISYKEAREKYYWLRLLRDSESWRTTFRIHDQR